MAEKKVFLKADMRAFPWVEKKAWHLAGPKAFLKAASTADSWELQKVEW